MPRAADAAGPFSVDYWGSHPDAGNDDCWTGQDFATLAEAEAFFEAAPDAYHYSDTAYVTLCGPGVDRIRRHPGFRPARDSGQWQREIAHQAGMGLGIRAFNEAMGADCDPDEG